MYLYALVREYENIIPMIFSIKDVAEIFPSSDETFMITLIDGRDFFCEQVGYNPELLSVDFTNVNVTICNRNIYAQKDFIKTLVKLRNS